MRLADLPLGPSGKPPYKGSRATGDDARYIYHVRGSNTAEFMRYDAATDSWSLLPDVPVGTKPTVKGGADLVFVKRYGTGYVYLLRGKGPDYYRYNTSTGAWSALPSPPFEPRGREGNWLCYDLERYIYCQPAKGSMMYRFDVSGDTWLRDSLHGVPWFNLQTGRNKKPGEGGGGAWHDGLLYTLKGNNTQDIYSFDPETGQWGERETVPGEFFYNGKRTRVKVGGDMISYEGGNVPAMLFILKGGKTDELWRYEQDKVGAPKTVPAPAQVVATAPRPAEDAPRAWSTLAPSCSPGTACFDALGRKVNATGSLRPGVYYVGPARRRVVVVR